MTTKGAPRRRERAVAGKRVRIGIVVSRFNEEVTKRLLEGAIEGLREAGVSDRRTTVVEVPGAFELPGAAQILIRSGKVDAVVALGAVIRGETDHHVYVASAAQQGVLRVALDHDVPVTFGVVTTDDHEQALNRAGGTMGNKGFEAALDAVEMAVLYRKLRPRKG